ncbi:MAG: hypothetical protein GY696_05490 [Gammaproteobacteria bacterium]|nr:hypothetical protein [Gammaproteobacteria bacterium]
MSHVTCPQQHQDQGNDGAFQQPYGGGAPHSGPGPVPGHKASQARPDPDGQDLDLALGCGLQSGTRLISD